MAAITRRRRLAKRKSLLTGVAATTLLAVAATPGGATDWGGRQPLVGQRIGYFPSWGVWDGFHVKDVAKAAPKLTVLNYAFAQVSKDGVCFEANNTPQGDAWANFQRPTPSSEAVDGVADRPSQKLKGNFNQLRKLKKRNPHLKIVMSLMSSHFSDAALTAKSRKKLVSSCVDLYIKGDLPALPGEDKTEGGPGSAFGVFDGIDIDWEYPASENAHKDVHRAEDTVNFTLLMKEFRRQLDEAGKQHKRHYLLTAALPPSKAKREKIELSKVAGYSDFLNVMTYDFAGPWEAKGPTRHMANLYPTREGGISQFSASESARAYVKGGVPAKKVVLGMPFYGYGWKGVGPKNNGLFQPAEKSIKSKGYSFIKKQPGKVFRDPTTAAAWKYDKASKTFWTYDDPTTIRTKAEFIRKEGLGGAMIWSLGTDDSKGTLLNALHDGLQNPR